MSCDNLADNGQRLRDAVHAFAAIVAPGLGEWLARNARFPNAMVDRITPATTDTLIDAVQQQGLPAAAPVQTEPFSEWVIEDVFAGPRPGWESVGVQLVQDVSSYERRKLRLLNGAHSLLAYHGSLRGYTCVHDAIADADMRALVDDFMGEAASTVHGDAAQDVNSYRERLIERFANPALTHRLEQIAMDGTLKLPLRVLPVIAARAAEGRSSPAACTAVASWAVYTLLQMHRGERIDDPQREAIDAAGRQSDPLAALLALLPLQAADEAPLREARRLLEHAGHSRRA